MTIKINFGIAEATLKWRRKIAQWLCPEWRRETQQHEHFRRLGFDLEVTCPDMLPQWLMVQRWLRARNRLAFMDHQEWIDAMDSGQLDRRPDCLPLIQFTQWLRENAGHTTT